MVDIRCCFVFSLRFAFCSFAIDILVTFAKKREHDNLPIWICYEMHTRNAEENAREKNEASYIAR